MITLEVFWLQSTAKALFETTNAEATTERLHIGLLPDGSTNGIDLGLMIYRLRDAVLVSPPSCQLRNVNGLFQLGPVEHFGRCVDAAINTEPAFGDHSSEVGHRPASSSFLSKAATGTRAFVSTWVIAVLLSST
jgi:hypothetical protein